MNHTANEPENKAGTMGMTGGMTGQSTESSGKGMGDGRPESQSDRSYEAKAGTSSKQSMLTLLRTLAAQCRDSEAGYRQAYENADDRSLRIEFGRLVDEREDMCRDLDRCLRDLGETPPESGTTLGAAHRIFVGLKAAIRGRDREAILREVVRGESVFEATYDAILRTELPSSIGSTIRNQHRQVRESRDHFKSMLSSRFDEPGSTQISVGSVATAIEKNPTISCAILAAAATGFAAALWMTRSSGRR